MKKAMLIAEKPSLMRDIQNAYNHCKDKVAYDIDFFSQVGHLLELIDPVELNPIYKSWDINLLPIRPENEGGWKYKIKKNTKTAVPPRCWRSRFLQCRKFILHFYQFHRYQ